MHLLGDGVLAAIRHGRFELDCVRMAMRRQSGGPETFVGGGSIRQTPNGELACVLYDTNIADAFSETFSQLPPGEWLGPEHFWRLTASDLDGETWEAEWVDVDTSSTSV